MKGGDQTKEENLGRLRENSNRWSSWIIKTTTTTKVITGKHRRIIQQSHMAVCGSW
jgi:hypothetical protein